MSRKKVNINEFRVIRKDTISQKNECNNAKGPSTLLKLQWKYRLIKILMDLIMVIKFEFIKKYKLTFSRRV